jgi:dimethylglycine dehydrogenase
MAGRLQQPVRIALSPMLTPKGKLYGDLTVACLKDDDFMIFGSGAAQARAGSSPAGVICRLNFRPDFTAAQSGLEVFIHQNKDFIGKEVA